ncbi:MAG TPA: hypothetical protein VHW90_08630 [Stellaceae bacterium]|nr:hypothetical protein [Stellaceae bacterium]
MLERLCADTLRHNEEDRLFGLISLTVRSTIKYENGIFSPDLIDDSVQDALAAMIDACPKIDAAPDSDRLGMVVEMIRDATTQHINDKTAEYSEKEIDKASAADLSEELSAPEIDAWLDALPPRQRAIALFLYASDTSRDDVAEAVGLPATDIEGASRDVKADLLRFFRENWDRPLPPPIPPAPAVEFREADAPLAAILKPLGPPFPLIPVAATKPLPGAAPPPAPPPPNVAGITAKVTGISSDVYAGWSLLVTVTGLPPDRSLDLHEPILLAPNASGRRRMIAVALDEISDPHDEKRRFLLKAFAIDAEKEGAGLHDSFHLGAAAIDNAQANRTLANHGLAAIETARCLWHDYGTAEDPGLCR